MMMMWMVWAVMVAGMLALSAWLAERALGERGWPTRFPWLAALGASATLPLLGVWSRTGKGAAVATGQVDSGWLVLDPAWFSDVSAVATASVPVLGEGVEDLLVVGWIVGSTVVALALFGGLALLRSRASRWHRARVQGENVLLSRDFGPALVGVVHPEIVLPRWALRMSDEDQRLACMHEAEHRAAHDTWVLLTGALVVAAMPWNLALWWQLRRLRAAVEVDCDGRVLRRGASKRAYGALLLELGAARGRSPLPVLAFARSESLLERRLKMIVRNVRDRNIGRALGAACLSAAVFVLACETEAPTAMEGSPQVIAEESAAGTFQIKRIPGTAAGVAAPITGELKARLDAGEVRFFVDGEENDDPTDLDPATIDRVEVRKHRDGTASAVYVFTKERAEGGRVQIRGTAQGDEDPLIYVDGVRLEEDLSTIEPSSIESVEVLKGGVAATLYGEEGANGVIRITLKKLPTGDLPR